VDTNILISAAIRDSGARAVLLFPFFRFFAPEHALVEMERHYTEISEKMGLGDQECRRMVDVLLSAVKVVPGRDFKAQMPMAREIMKDIDEDDTAFLALALSFENDGIWSEDRDFQNQTAVRVWRTGELLKML
jgi:predicted nucleic acid-binding protein